MTVDVRYAPQAERDLQSIGDYLEREASPRVARRWIARLLAAAEALAEMPLIGVQDEDLGGRRRLIVRPYLIIYRTLDDGSVRIVRVVHGARDIPSLFASSNDD